MKNMLNAFKSLAAGSYGKPMDGLSETQVRHALLIRAVENKFLELFSKGLMNGTVHTCVGQELSAVAVCSNLNEGDWITSNHRCHGHFIAKTGNWQGLIDELMGLKSGVCRGIGSSQHLYTHGFMSNGNQAALVPVGGGIALSFKKREQKNVVASYIGEGTLGEGVLYEAMNIASLWKLPQLFICENNLYSQSTPQEAGISGSIAKRAEAFELRVFEANTWDTKNLMSVCSEAISYVRDESQPAFLIIKTYRLNAHSKGDDDRDQDEVEFFKKKDPINLLLADNYWRGINAQILREVDKHVEGVKKEYLSLDEYAVDQLPRRVSSFKSEISNQKVRMVQALNKAYAEVAESGSYLIGEDIADPYGGAFKVTKGIADAYPLQVLTTPISEAAIVGVGIGLSIVDKPAYVEIMFGDFITNIFDQLLSNASKLHHMYAHQISVPVKIRTPMGGKRGYGPTHSQSLEKHILGVDNLAVVALTSLEDPLCSIREINSSEFKCPAFIIENKLEYGRYLWQGNNNYKTEKINGPLGSILLKPLRRKPTITVVTYGENARTIADSLERVFIEADHVLELVVPILLHPLDIRPIIRSINNTGLLLTIEDGSKEFAWGAEIISRLMEEGLVFKAHRIGALPIPVPSVIQLENEVLPSIENIIKKISAIS